jgi:uncharacterized protein
VSNVRISWYGVVARSQHILLTTYRKSGKPISTPVWFARDSEQLYFYTLATSGKVKRLRHTTHVQVAPCTANGRATGSAIVAEARFVSDLREWQRARFILWRRYNVRMLAVQALTTVQHWLGSPRAEKLYIALDAASVEVADG